MFWSLRAAFCFSALGEWFFLTEIIIGYMIDWSKEVFLIRVQLTKVLHNTSSVTRFSSYSVHFYHISML